MNEPARHKSAPHQEPVQPSPQHPTKRRRSTCRRRASRRGRGDYSAPTPEEQAARLAPGRGWACEFPTRGSRRVKDRLVSRRARVGTSCRLHSADESHFFHRAHRNEAGEPNVKGGLNGPKFAPYFCEHVALRYEALLLNGRRLPELHAVLWRQSLGDELVDKLNAVVIASRFEH
eukprot:6204952-Pleurochrysis_carterae.AAC.9